MKPQNYNEKVTEFLNEKKHPYYDAIEKLRIIILTCDTRIDENIKWNGPNYSVNGEDRITMRLFPPKSFQLIFHCGAKPRLGLKEKLIIDDRDLLIWKSNDRALLDLTQHMEVDSLKEDLEAIIKKWIQASW